MLAEDQFIHSKTDLIFKEGVKIQWFTSKNDKQKIGTYWKNFVMSEERLQQSTNTNSTMKIYYSLNSYYSHLLFLFTIIVLMNGTINI